MRTRRGLSGFFKGVVMRDGHGGGLRLFLAFSACVSTGILSASCKWTGKETAMSSRIDYSRLVEVGNLEPIYYDRMTWKKIEKPDVQLAGSFSPDGLAPAVPQGGQYDNVGYVDMLGHFIIKPAFSRAENFSEGRAVVTVGLQKGLIDTLGRWIVEPGKYEWISTCKEGRCSFRTKTMKCGFLDRNGKEVIPPIYQDAGDFAEGLASVDDENGQYFIDVNGKVQITAPKDVMWMFSFSQGLAEVWFFQGEPDENGEREHRVGFVDQKGKVVVKPQFRSADAFSEGLAAVTLTDTQPHIGSNFEVRSHVRPESRWGFINVAGEVVIPMTFEKVGCFREGLARFVEKGKWGYLDRFGKVVIPARYDMAGDFRNGLAGIVARGKLGYIDHTGATVLMTDIDYLTW